MNLRDAIQQMADKGEQVYSEFCVVDKGSVNEDLRVFNATPIKPNHATITNVRMQAVGMGKGGLIMVPEEGSRVIVTFLNDFEGYMALGTKLKKVLLQVGNTTTEIVRDKDGGDGSNSVITVKNGTEDDSPQIVMEGDQIKISNGKASALLKDDKITLNGGSLGGMVKIQELSDNLKSLKSYCETLTTAVSAGLNAVGTSTAASGVAGKTKFESEMTDAAISLKNMENKNVLHG